MAETFWKSRRPELASYYQMIVPSHLAPKYRIQLSIATISLRRTTHLGYWKMLGCDYRPILLTVGFTERSWEADRAIVPPGARARYGEDLEMIVEAKEQVTKPAAHIEQSPRGSQQRGASGSRGQ
jgi:hypothetical protein